MEEEGLDPAPSKNELRALARHRWGPALGGRAGEEVLMGGMAAPLPSPLILLLLPYPSAPLLPGKFTPPGVPAVPGWWAGEEPKASLARSTASGSRAVPIP